MTHPAVTLTNEIVTALNAATFSPAITATKNYLVETNLESAALRVTVKPALEFHEKTRATRGGAYTETMEIGVAIQSQVDPTDTDAFETLLNLVDDIGQELEDATTTATLISNPEDPRAASIQLDERNYFLAVITLRYKLIRS